MKRALSLILCIALVCSFTINVFAEEFNLEDTDLNSIDTGAYSFITVIKSGYDGEYHLYLTHAPFIYAGDKRVYTVNGEWVDCNQYDITQPSDNPGVEYVYNVNNNDWGRKPGSFTGAGVGGWLQWTSYNLSDSNGSVVNPGSPFPGSECDGSSCPARDLDHDNFCDDCGLPLTATLRSTLLDFAKARAEFYKDTYHYYAITEHATNDKYLLVFLSKEPMVAGGSNYDIVTGTDMQWATVMENSDGTFGHTTIYPIDSWSGTLVYANHKIANFLAPPLAVVIQGVTGEALKVEIPALGLEIRTITITAVCCLALLVGLVLLSRRFRAFLP